MKKIASFSVILLAALPLVASAQFTGTKQLISSAGDIVQTLTKIMMAAALLAFFFGLAKFLFRLGGDEKAVEQGKSIMIWGIVSLFVMVSIWGIVGFFQNELNLPNTTSPGLLPSRNPLLNSIYTGPGGLESTNPSAPTSLPGNAGPANNI